MQPTSPISRLTIDFETRSAADLKAVGAWVYSQHATTEVLCLGYAFNDDAPSVWHPGLPDPAPVLGHIAANLPVSVVAHNVPFEYAIWANVIARDYPHWPKLTFEQLDDTMARALALSWPGRLDDLTKAMHLDVQKDMDGHRLMLKLSKPRKPRKGEPKDVLLWHDDPHDLERLYAYCAQDIEAEQAVDRALPPLSRSERKLWLLDQRINQRGFAIDLPAARAAREISEAAKEELHAELSDLTGGVAGKATQLRNLQGWLATQGLKTDTLRKNDVSDLLTGDSLDLLYDDNVRRALEIRAEAGKGSLAKTTPMVLHCAADGRVRNQFAYHGATTGRWAGRGIQPHNLPRLAEDMTADDVERVLSNVAKPYGRDLVETLYGSAVDTLKSCLRGMIIAKPGHELIGGDFANIEGRVLAWLAGEQWKLDAFRAYDAGKGPDLYRVAYAKSFSIPIEQVTGEQRQIGKVQELSMGYQGGVGAFKTMGANYGVAVLAEGERAPPKAKMVLTEDQAEEIKRGWRDAHPAVVNYWYEIERLAISAVRNPGQLQTDTAGKVRFIFKGVYLYCVLPNGRALAYPYPSIIRKMHPKTGRTNEAIRFMGKHPVTGKWTEVDTYGGKLVENIDQATSRDLLAGAISRLENAGLPVVIHVHDEARAEVPIGSVSLEKVVELMTAGEPWSKGLPIALSASRAKRFGK